MTSSHAIRASATISASATITASAREAHVFRNPVRRPAARLRPALVPALVPALALALALVVAACGGGGGIKVTDAWARNSPAVAAAGAAYMVIENTGSAADALIGASSTVAKATEVHETVEMPAASDGTSSGMMGMQPVSRVEIPAGGKLELKPGSYHVMLIGLNQELKVGDTIEITLKLEKAGEIKVTVEVRAG